MKKILSMTLLTGTLFISGMMFASAYYTPYYNVYQNAPTSNSYVYTQGCYTYQYDRYTQVTSLIGSTCQTNTSYTYPTTQYSYVAPAQQTYYTYPSYNYGYVQPVAQTYHYSHGAWYPTTNYTNSYYNTNSYYDSYNYTSYSPYSYTGTSNGCYWSNGYQVCY